MTCGFERLSARYAPLIALFIAAGAPYAFAQQLQQPETVAEIPAPASRSLDHDTSGARQAGDQPLSEFEKMDLHHRRYATAANNMAQLFKQLNQKIQEVSLAAKMVEAKDSSHNRRLLETKLNQLENARQSYSVQYSQLQSQMQNEYRNYAALSNNLRAKYDTTKDSKRPEDTGSGSGSAKAKPAKSITSETKNTKNVRDTKTRNMKATQSEAEEPLSVDRPPKDPRVIDMDTQELREKRDGKTKPATSYFEPAQFE